MEIYGELEHTYARLQTEIKERIAYINLRKKCIAEMKRLGLIPEGYVEHYYVLGQEV